MYTQHIYMQHQHAHVHIHTCIVHMKTPRNNAYTCTHIQAHTIHMYTQDTCTHHQHTHAQCT